MSQERAIKRLATYGTLAPGRSNFEQVAMLGGSWSTGTVRGHLKEAGWGAQHGYPGLVLDPNGPEVQVHILEADALAAHWERLDAFEGSGYRRTVTQVMTRDGFVSAYIYALSEPN